MHSRILWFVLVTLLASCHSGPRVATPGTSAAPPEASPEVDASSEEAYTASARALLKRALAQASVEITEPRTIVVKSGPTDGGKVVSLDRVWQECTVNRPSCDKELRHFVQVVAGTISSETPQ